MRGRAGASAGQAATVIEALAEVCPALRPSPEEMRLASELAERHDLTLYDAAYAAVAQSRWPSDLTEAIAVAARGHSL